MKTYEGLKVQLREFLLSALVGGKWSASHSGHFITGERVLCTHWIGWVGPRAGLDAVVPSGSRNEFKVNFEMIQ
jgi:hypothetical protein